MSGERIDIAMGFDAQYAPHAAAVIASAVRAAPGAQFRVIILHDGMPDDLRCKLQSVAPGATFVWREINPAELPAFDRGVDLKHVNAATFLRLGLETLAPEDCKRVIYLDADTIVFGDLREIWNADLGGAPIGGCPDTYIDEAAFAARWNLQLRPNGYFNAGVLLIDLEQVRAEAAFSKAMAFVREHQPVFADQDALNWVFWGRWAALDTRWNVQRDMLIDTVASTLPAEKRFAGGAPGIVHFTGKDKPWLREGWHPWAWSYWRSLAHTGFTDEIARRHSVGLLQRLRLLLRYLRRPPSLSRA